MNSVYDQTESQVDMNEVCRHAIPEFSLKYASVDN